MKFDLTNEEALELAQHILAKLTPREDDAFSWEVSLGHFCGGEHEILELRTFDADGKVIDFTGCAVGAQGVEVHDLLGTLADQIKSWRIRRAI